MSILNSFPQKIKSKTFIMVFIVFSLICFFTQISNAGKVNNLNLDKSNELETECIICPQYLPECKEDEVLINQTCQKCSHCEKKQKATKNHKKLY